MGEIMEISGLNQAPSQAAPVSADTGFPWWTLAAVGLPALLMGGLVTYFFTKQSDYAFDGMLSGLSGLGIIKPCSKRDMTKRKSRRAQKWCLMDSKGKRVLGRHSTRSKAARQERAIQARKH